MSPFETWQPIFKVVRGWTGYSHLWRKDFAQPYKTIVNASVETVAGYHEARARGWRPFRIRRPDEALLPNERVCPASEEGGFKVQCDNCLACSGAKGHRNLCGLSVLAHGGLNLPERFAALSLAGRLVPALNMKEAV